MSATAAVRAVLLAVVALLLVPVGARAADLPPAGTVVTLTGPTQQAMRTTATLVAAVTDADGTPEPGVTVRLESLTGGSWQPVTSAVTDDAGQASLPAPLSAVSTSNLFRAVVDTGAGVVTSATWSVTGVPRSAPLRISLNTHRVVDGRSITLSLRWITGDGLGVPGTVQVTARAERRTTVVAVLHLGSDGRASVRLTPRYDTSYRATGAAGAWWTSATAGPSTSCIDQDVVCTSARLVSSSPRTARRIGEPPRPPIRVGHPQRIQPASNSSRCTRRWWFSWASTLSSSIAGTSDSPNSSIQARTPARNSRTSTTALRSQDSMNPEST